ncbi:hypothetical protein, conserved in T. vivax [Trypanosoma vivax Y486]|uniref:Uncharacterized protein n=1 Tax=Trypanosoma vivax (strain Y486) TaxID=1055687 RepID=F9WSK3_TRYVY|nr:hypothetical protein, conserved in T. vivax [Trypanosoma vivax Y486]|eukprot:CCD20542.1 hypothetical protein, conserved in T. vivax [Trypanosoma vivax Y486]
MNTLQALAAAFVFSVVTVTGARGAANSAGLRLNDAQALCSASAVLKALGHAADTATKEALAAAGHAKLWHSTATRLAEETNNASVLSVAEAAARTLADTLALSDKAAKAREAATQQARRIDDIIEIFATYSGQADSTNGRLCIEKTSNNAQTTQAGDASVAAVVKALGCAVDAAKISEMATKILAEQTLNEYEVASDVRVARGTLKEQVEQPQRFTASSQSNTQIDVSTSNAFKACPLTPSRSWQTANGPGVRTLDAQLTGTEQGMNKGQSGAGGWAWKPLFAGLILMTPAGDNTNHVNGLSTQHTAFEWSAKADDILKKIVEDTAQTVKDLQALRKKCTGTQAPCGKHTDDAEEQLRQKYARRYEAQDQPDRPHNAATTQDIGAQKSSQDGGRTHPQNTHTPRDQNTQTHRDTARGAHSSTFAQALGGLLAALPAPQH